MLGNKTLNSIMVENNVLKQSRFEIKGFFNKEYNLFQTEDINCIYIPYEYFVDQEVNKVVLELNNFNEFENIDEAIYKINLNYKVTYSQSQYINQINEFDDFSNKLDAFSVTLIILVSVLLGVMHFFTAMNQKYEIAVLKANGLSNKEMMTLMFVYFKNMFLKSLVFISICLCMAKMLFLVLGKTVHLLTFSNIIIILFLTGIVYIIPNIIATIIMIRFDPEKLLRF